MSGTIKFSQLPPANPLGGTELIPGVQGGADVVTTPQALALYTSENLFPGVTNVNTLGTQAKAFSQAYLGPNGTPVLNDGVVGYWPQTAAEEAAGVTPTNFAYQPLDIRRYGVDPTGSSDSTAGIQAAIAVAAQMNGGVVRFPAGTFKTTGISVTTSGIVLQGEGYSGYNYTSATPIPSYSTIILYAGTSGGIAVNVTSVNITTVLPIQGNGVSGFYINGNGLAATGLAVQSVRGGKFENVHVDGVLTQAFLINALSTTGAIDSTTVQYCDFSRLSWNLVATVSQSANGMTLTSTDPPATSGTDVSFNTFHMCRGAHFNGIGFVLAASDNNSFIGCTASRRGSPGGAGLSIRGMDENLFWDFSTYGAGGIEVLGTASGYGANPSANCFMCIDNQNGTTYPTIDANCSVQWHGSSTGWITLRAQSVSGQKVFDSTSMRGATEAGADISLGRQAGSTANAVQEGANLTLGDDAGGTSTCLQQSGGQTEIWQYNGGAWKQVAFWTAGGNIGLYGAGVGTQNATFSATNKPGTTSKTSPDTWIPVVLNGITYFIPAFGS